MGSGEKVHNKLGQYIPPTLPGTKKYWAKEYLDLAAFCERCGVPDFFVTLTANDSWPELKKFLNGVGRSTFSTCRNHSPFYATV